MRHNQRSIQLPSSPRCRQRVHQGSQLRAIRRLNRIQTWLIMLTMLQGVALLALIRLAPPAMRWSAPSPQPEVTLSPAAKVPNQRRV
jgi:hypothetical protein